MSRVVVFGRDHKAEGEFTAVVNRGWMLAGNASVAGGGQTELQLTAEVASKSFLQFGHMVLIEHETLPAWAGMIDTPWKAGLPVTVACYNVEYLLSRRSPEQTTFLTGSIGAIVEQMIALFNAGDDLYVRIGDVSRADPTRREETLDGRTYWEQLKAILQRANCEMQTRAEKDAEGHLVIYLDIAQQLGIDTGFLFVDGKDGNAAFRDVVLDGDMRNRVMGIGDESGQTSRLTTAPFQDTDSIALYGMRSEVVQFRGVVEQGTLDLYSQNYLHYSAWPRLGFLMDILHKGQAFLNARLGNIVRARISQSYWPGGVQGWQGSARILALAYSEAQNLLTAKVESV